MFDVKTILNKIHRPVRPVARGFVCQPGLWAYLDNDGILHNIPNTSETQAQPQVLKPMFNTVANERYEGNDVVVGRVATLEGVFRAYVDSSGFQVTDNAGNAIVYAQGMPLTPAYRIHSVPVADFRYALPADIGKLRPATYGDVVVAYVEWAIPAGRVIEYMTCSPHPYGGDDLWDVIGSGRGTVPAVTGDGDGNWNPLDRGTGTIDMEAVTGTGLGTKVGNRLGVGDEDIPAVTDVGAGTRNPGTVPGPDRGAYEYVP